MGIGWIDTHAHMMDSEYDNDREGFIERAAEAGISKILIICCSIQEARKALELYQEDERFDIAAGFHPSDIPNLTEKDWLELEEIVRNPRVIAVGEIGLDYYWDKEHKAEQQEAFIRQIQLANQWDKPILIHSRDAIQETYEICRSYPVKRKGIVHCFSSSLEMAKEFIKLGYYIALGGPVTFKNAKTPKEVAAGIDLEHLMLETDCPYLTPHPYRSLKNESMYLPVTAQTICELRGINLNTLKEVLDQNYKNLFDKRN